MLQDAIFASEAWLGQAGNEDVAVKFLKASFKGWIFCRDNPSRASTSSSSPTPKLPKGHQTWQLNEVNGIIWPAPKASASPIRPRSTAPSRSRSTARS